MNSHSNVSRFGVFEEHGWVGDSLYPGDNGGKACTVREESRSSKASENPGGETIQLCVLHKMLRSPIEATTKCNSSSTYPILTKQAVMCEGKSALEVASQHPDLQELEHQIDLRCDGRCQVKGLNQRDEATPPMQLEVVREPSSKVW